MLQIVSNLAWPWWLKYVVLRPKIEVSVGVASESEVYGVVDDFAAGVRVCRCMGKMPLNT